MLSSQEWRLQGEVEKRLGRPITGGDWQAVTDAGYLETSTSLKHAMTARQRSFRSLLLDGGFFRPDGASAWSTTCSGTRILALPHGPYVQHPKEVA